MILRFGKHKGKELREVPIEYLFWLVENTDTNDPKYGAKNADLVAACNAEINARSDRGRAEKPRATAPSQGNAKLISELKSLVKNIYDSATQMQFLIDEYSENGVVTRNSQDSPF